MREDGLAHNTIATYDGMEGYLSAYDLDTSWGINYDGTELQNYENELLNLSKSNLFARMDQAFSQQLAERYFELRADILSNERIMAEFEAFENQISERFFVKEAYRWSHNKNHSRKGLPGVNYDQIQDYLNSVSERLDAKYSTWME